MIIEKKLMVAICITLSAILVFSLIFAVMMLSGNDEKTPNKSLDTVVTNTPQKTSYKKTPHYKVTSEERELLARLVTCESDICSLECQKAVCSVIFNRLDSGKWKKDMNGDGKITLYDIIYYPNAFSPTFDGSMDKCTSPCKSAYEAVDYVINNGVTVPTYVRYFRADYDFAWEGYENYKVIDNVYFGYFEDWERGAW